MANKRKLEVIIAGDAKGLNKAFDSAGKEAKGFGSKLGGLAKVAGGFLAAGFATDKLIDWGTELVGLGNQVENWRAKTSTVFEDQAADVQAWAKDNAGALGITGDQLAGLAANFGDLLKPMGFTAEQAAAMSKETLDLSGALSAWSGGQRSAAEVSEILSKAMLGEREQLKELGISISEAEVQGRLAEKGQKDLTGAALAQAKALATQELIMEKSTDAQAAWADGTFDNVKAQNELSAKFAEVRETIAEKFLPIFNKAVGFLSDKVIPAVERVVDIFGKEGLGGVISHLGDSLSAAWPKIQATLQDAGVALWQWIQDAAPPALRALGRLVVGLAQWVVTTGLPALWDAVQVMAPALWEWIQEVTPPALTALGEWLGEVGDWIVDDGLPMLWEKTKQLGSALWEWIQDVTPPALRALGGLLADLGGWVVGTAVPWLARAAVGLAGALWEWIVDVTPPALRALGSLLADLGGWIVGTGIPWLAAKFVELSAAAWEWIVDVTPDALAALGELIVELGEWIIDDGLPLLVEKFEELTLAAWEWIVDVTPDALRALGDLIVDLGRWVINTGLPTLRDKVLEWAGAFVGWIVPATVDMLAKLPEIVQSLGAWILFDALPKIIKAIAGWASAFVGWIGDTVSDLPGKLGDIAGVVLGFIGGLPAKIGRAASGMWDGISNAFIDMLNGIIRKWNDFSFTLPSIDLGPLGTVGGQTFNTPNLPTIGGKTTIPGPARPTRNPDRRHAGGYFRAPIAGGEGLALLRDGERITDPRNDRLGDGDITIQLILDGRVVTNAVVTESQRRGGVPIRIRTTGAGLVST